MHRRQSRKRFGHGSGVAGLQGDDANTWHVAVLGATTYLFKVVSVRPSV